MEPRSSEPPVLHVVVVGFHHIKGYQLEYAYPPVTDGDPSGTGELPEPWKHLPSLALPDGAHNYEEDTIYFHLPALDNPKQTIFGISCYRQINSEKLLHRGSDVTRSSVQKSVCVLSRLPLFGLIQAKLQLVTHAYFEERDFSKVSLLEETYCSLNSLLSPDMLAGGQAFLGLSSRDLILHFKHKAVLLFKLLLLERKVLFYKTPVKDLCSTVLTLCSLFPGMIEEGLAESASTVGTRPPLQDDVREDDYPRVHEAQEEDASPSELKQSLDAVTTEKDTNHARPAGTDEKESAYGVQEKPPEEPSLLSKTIRSSESRGVSARAGSVDGGTTEDSKTARKPSQEEKGESGRISISSVGKELFSRILPATLVDMANVNRSLDDSVFEDEDKLVSEIEELLDSDPKDKAEMRSKLEFVEKDDLDSKSASTPSPCKETPTGIRGTSIWSKLPSAIYSLASKDPQTGIGTGVARAAEEEEVEADSRASPSEDGGGAVAVNPPETAPRDQEDLLLQSLPKLLALTYEECGLPPSIFTKGSLCLPYVSLPMIDALSNISVRSCVVGATNDLFKQKKHLFDVIVEIDEGKIDVLDADLRKQLNLTMEDLRFADCLVKNVLDDSRDIFLDGTGWQGGDEWLRAQFKIYLVSLLKTAQLEDGSKEHDSFNASFVTTWKTTHNFKMWNSVEHPCLLDVPTGHFYRGQLSVADMKLRISHSIQSSERGRRINRAVVSTGRAVAQTTGKVVGGALTSARSVVSSLWSHFNAVTPGSSQETLSPPEEGLRAPGEDAVD